ncbi:hypothetical protein LCGC14_0580130, partial [marine sediment metagenome]
KHLFLYLEYLFSLLEISWSRDTGQGVGRDDSARYRGCRISLFYIPVILYTFHVLWIYYISIYILCIISLFYIPFILYTFHVLWIYYIPIYILCIISLFYIYYIRNHFIRKAPSSITEGKDKIAG